MATINGSTNSSLWSYRADVYEINTSIENNNSVVRVDVWLGRLQSRSYVGGTWSGYISINPGTSEQLRKDISGGIPYPTYIDAGGWIHLATVDFTVPHNPDGSKTIRVLSEITQTQFTPSHCNVDGQVGLSTIPRATKCPNLTGFIKSSYNLSLLPASSAFTHSLYVEFGNIKKWLQSDGTLGANEHIFSTRNPLITLSKEFYQQFNGYEGVGNFTLKTYNNGQLIGNSRGTVRTQCNPALCNPIVLSATVVDINPQTLYITNNENYIIKEASSVLITPIIQISDPDDTTATITTKSINGTIFNTDTYTVDKPLDKQFTLTLTNSRNLTTNNIVSATGEFINYVPLTFNVASLYRPEPTTGEIQIKYNGFYFDDSFVIDNGDNIKTVDNTLAITWKYREKNATDWTNGGSLSPIISHDNNSYEGNESLGTIFDYTKQYEFAFFYNDKLVIAVSNDHYVSRGFPVFWWDADSFHVLGDLYVNDTIITSGGSVSPTEDIYSTDEKQIGKWIDGKPVYRKSLTFTAPSNSAWKAIATINNIENIIDIKGSVVRGEEIYPLYYNDTQQFKAYFNKHDNTLNIQAFNSYMYGYPGIITIEYTKTTD